MSSPAGHVVDRQAALKQLEHLNYRNPDKFGVEDLDLMMRGVENPAGPGPPRPGRVRRSHA